MRKSQTKRYATAANKELFKSKQSPLDRYFSILEVLAAHPNLGISAIAEKSRLPFGTAHRLVQGLAKSGLIVSSSHGRTAYALGSRLLRILQSGSDEWWVKATVQKVLDEAADRLSETCYVAKLGYREVFSLAWAAPRSGLRGYVVPGLLQPLHAAACAKAILAFHPAESVTALLPNPLPKLCTNTKTSLKDVLSELALVRKRGFATCIDENELGVAAVACPIPIPNLEVMYSIGVVGLRDRLSIERLTEIATVLKNLAALVSNKIHN